MGASGALPTNPVAHVSPDISGSMVPSLGVVPNDVHCFLVIVPDSEQANCLVHIF